MKLSAVCTPLAAAQVWAVTSQAVISTYLNSCILQADGSLWSLSSGKQLVSGFTALAGAGLDVPTGGGQAWPLSSRPAIGRSRPVAGKIL